MSIGRSSAAEHRVVPPALLRRAGWVVVGLSLAAMAGFPLLELGREVAAAGSAAIGRALGQSRGPVANTMWTSAVATALTLAGATAAAMLAARLKGRSRTALVVGMVVPLLVPPFVSALSFTAAYGPGGVLDDLLGLSAGWLYGPAGIVLLLVVSALPIAFLILTAALETRQERDLVRAARVAGATPGEALRTVTLPLLRPALVAAGAVTFIMSANAFGVPMVLGTPAGFGTATTRIYRDLVLSADPAAFDRVLVLAAFLAVVTLTVVAIGDRAAHARVRLRVEATGPRLPSSNPPRPASGAAVAYIVLTAALPLLALVSTALIRGPGLAPTPDNWTLGNFGAAIDSGTVAAVRTSLALAVVAATVALGLGSLLTAAERRRHTGLGTAAALSFAVPGSVLAVAVLLAYGSWLRDTLLIILIAYLAKFWALAHRPIAGSANSVSPESFGAARLAGASRWVATRTITIPLLRPALAVAWLLVFLFALHELTISSLLHGPGTETLAVAVLDLQQLGDTAVTAALAVMLTFGSVALVVPLAWLVRGRPRSSG